MSHHVAVTSVGLAVLTLRVVPGEPRIRIIPAGRFEAPRGAMAGSGPWNLTAQGAARIIAINAGRQADILVDYEHQLLSSKDNGKEVPAAGWIDPRSLVWIDSGAEPGLYGSVKWTARAAELIATDQYRYLSPVFKFDTATGEPTDLLNVALTNFPAIDAPLNAAALAGAMSVGVGALSLGEQHSIEAFNRSFGPIGVFHPETDRAIAATGWSRSDYMASLGCKIA